jgi:hypothetical protein
LTQPIFTGGRLASALIGLPPTYFTPQAILSGDKSSPVATALPLLATDGLVLAALLAGGDVAPLLHAPATAKVTAPAIRHLWIRFIESLIGPPLIFSCLGENASQQALPPTRNG